MVDTDVHVLSKSGWPDLRRYVVDDGWAARLDLYRNRFSRVKAADQPGLASPDGSRPGSDPDRVREELLDRFGVEHAVLVPYEVLHLALITQIADSVEVARIYNEYFIERWLPVDPRYSLAVGVSPHDPYEAAREIARVGPTPGVSAVLMPVLNIMLGHRHYYPIYEAAASANLTVIVHRGYEGAATPQYAAGLPATALQRECMFGGQAMANVTSLVLEGTFQRFPRLKLVFADWGFSWLVHQLPRMDRIWSDNRDDLPWLEAPPSTFVREHIRFGLQPADAAEADDLAERIRLAGAERMVLFGSDYPFSGGGPPDYLATLPDHMKHHILRGCALEAFPRLGDRRTSSNRADDLPG